MIFGLGTDIVAIARLRDMLASHGERLAERLLGPAERKEFHQAADPARFLAKRFAAKEAFGKALGTGLRMPATLHAICIAHDPLGKPFFDCTGALAEHLREHGLVSHLSLSDERDYVVAVAILERH